MHPMLRTRIWQAVVPILIIGAGILGMLAVKATEQEKTDDIEKDLRPRVSVRLVEKIDYAVPIKSFGEVEPVETVNLAAQVGGQVTSWHPNFVSGGFVKRNDILFTLDDTPYQAALSNAKAQLMQAQAVLAEELARQQVAEQEATTLPTAKLTDLYLRKPQVLSARANVLSAEAAVAMAERDIALTQIRAPFDALVVRRDIGRGEVLNAGSIAGQLHNIEQAEIRVPIAGFDDAFLPNNLTGISVTVRSDSNQFAERIGQISRDTGLIDNATRMSQVIITVDDPYGLRTGAPSLPFGSYVGTEFLGARMDNVVKVPQTLVNNNRVWLVDSEDRLTAVDVTVARDDENSFILSSGLEQSDRLVLDLPEYPQQGMAVKILNKTALKVKAKSHGTSQEML